MWLSFWRQSCKQREKEGEKQNTGTLKTETPTGRRWQLNPNTDNSETNIGICSSFSLSPLHSLPFSLCTLHTQASVLILCRGCQVIRRLSDTALTHTVLARTSQSAAAEGRRWDVDAAIWFSHKRRKNFFPLTRTKYQHHGQRRPLTDSVWDQYWIYSVSLGCRMWWSVFSFYFLFFLRHSLSSKTVKRLKRCTERCESGQICFHRSFCSCCIIQSNLFHSHINKYQWSKWGGKGIAKELIVDVLCLSDEYR